MRSFACARTSQHTRIIAATAALLLVFVDMIVAAPGLAFPINSQVPPVARVGKPFDFVFAASTFSSASIHVEYRLSDAPAWLKFDGPTRSFYGTPDTRDIGAARFGLTATDDTGSTVMPITLVVSAETGPSTGLPVTQQLPSFGTFSSPDAILMYPSSPLFLKFGPQTFTNTDDKTVYYAVCANNTPLPSWISFDSKSLSLAGTAPTFTSPTELPQDFSIHLIASDVVGFSAAVASFRLIIGSHELTFGAKDLRVEVAPERPLNSTTLQAALLLDGVPVQTAHLRQVSADAPGWLTLDPHTLLLSGTTPKDFKFSSFSISVTDVFGDTANATVTVTAVGSYNLIQKPIGRIDATIGRNLSYTFDRADFASGDVQIMVDLSNTSSWLRFDSSSLTLSGIVPSTFVPQTDSLRLSVTLGSRTESQPFEITLVHNGGSDSGPSSSVNTLPSAGHASSTAFPAPSERSASGDSPDNGAARGRMAAAILIPILAVLIVTFCIGYLRRRRRSRLHEQDRKISRPVLQEANRRESPPEAIPSGLSNWLASPLDLLKLRHPPPPPSDLEKSPPKPPRRQSVPPQLGPPLEFAPADADRRWSRPILPPRDPLRDRRKSKHDSLQSFFSHGFPAIISREKDKRVSATLPSSSIHGKDSTTHGVEAVIGPSEERRQTSMLSTLGSLKSSSYPRRSMMSSVPGSMSARLSGVGHGSGRTEWSQSSHFRRRSTLSSSYGLGHGRGCLHRLPSGPPGSNRIRKSWRNRNVEEDTDGEWESIGTSSNSLNHSNASQSMKSFLHYPPTRSSTAPVHTIHEDQPTIRQVQPSAGSYSPTKYLRDRDRYTKYRNRCNNTNIFVTGRSSGRFSRNPTVGSVVPTKTTTAAAADDCTSSSNSGVDKENRPFDIGRSKPSAVRKGEMMQQHFGALNFPKRRGPLFSRSESAQSSTPSQFENANGSGYDTDDLLRENTDPGGLRVWSRGLSELLAADDGKRKRLSLQRLSRLGDEGGIRSWTESAEEKEVVLGERGKVVISVENEMDVRRGRPGSASLRGNLEVVEDETDERDERGSEGGWRRAGNAAKAFV